MLQKAKISLFALLLCALVTIISFGLIAKTAHADQAPKFLIYQVQTRSSSSSGSDLVSIVNASTEPQTLDGLCLKYAAASSNSWTNKGCFENLDEDTVLMLPSYGRAYFATEQFIAENPGFTTDKILKSGFSDSGGALKLVNSEDETEDLVGWGTSINFETTPAPTVENSQILQRKVQKSQLVDTDNNSQDFEIREQVIEAVLSIYELELPPDLCNNIALRQETIPTGYDADGKGNCYEDICPNLEGLQKDLPSGYQLENGECVEVVLESAAIEISEILPNASDADEGKEFIEIYNPNAKSVNLAGYKLLADTKEYIFGQQEILPKEYLAFSDQETNITLPNSSGLELILLAANGNKVSTSPVYSGSPEDQSWALVNGAWQWTNQPSPNSQNKQSAEDPKDEEESSGSTSQLKPCAANQYRNPETNRCKLISSTSSSLTPCAANQYRNPATNRCKNVASATSSLVPCKAGQVRNPETNRCKSTSSASSTLTPCKAGQVRNPETNRCRKISLVSSARNPASALKPENLDQAAAGSAVNWLAISGVSLAAAGYVVYEWRQEIARGLAGSRLKSLKYARRK